MIFRQLVEPLSNTYTYLLGCEDTKQALLIDLVLPAWERDLGVVRELGLKLAYTVETHVHADHITSGRRLKRETGSRIVVAALEGLACTDAAIEDGKPLVMGAVTLEPRHTAAPMAYVAGDKVFTGDALLIDGCGRTDFQNGDARALYKSVHERLFTLPDDQLVYPGHDYQDRRVSTIAQERKRNRRLGGGGPSKSFLPSCGGLSSLIPSSSITRSRETPRVARVRRNGRRSCGNTARTCRQARKADIPIREPHRSPCPGGDAMNFVKVAVDVYVGGAPSERELRRLAAEGVHAVVDFREPGERKGPKDGPLVAQDLGLAYINIPARAPLLADAQAEGFRETVAREPAGYLLRCAKGPRAEAMYVMKAMLGCRWGLPEVDRKAERRGFRDRGLPRLRDFVTGFIARHGGGAKGREA